MALLPANVADHVATVTVLANPLSRFGRPLTDLSPVYGVKTIDLCNGAARTGEPRAQAAAKARN
jgi:cutinase